MTAPTQYDAWQLARVILADCGCSENNQALLYRVTDRLLAFEDRAQAAEREACADLCEKTDDTHAYGPSRPDGYAFAAAIRARGES